MTSTLEPRTEATSAGITDAAFAIMVARLSRLSVERHAEAYVDIDWDSPELHIDADDPRCRLWPADPLGASRWYGAQTPEAQSRIGLYRWAACMKTGWHFENLLQQGLLVSALRLRNGSPEFRYLHHEIIEESQHTLMFQELVNRSGLPVRGMPRWALNTRPFIMWSAKRFPELFFAMVLGGEDPIDHVQRQQLKSGVTHPLIEAITRIHVAEEARHLSFARHQLKHRRPQMGVIRRQAVAMSTPIILGVMVRLMLVPPQDLRAECSIPRRVVHDAMASAAGRRLFRDSAGKPRRLYTELGLITPVSKLLWKIFGIWDEETG